MYIPNLGRNEQVSHWLGERDGSHLAHWGIPNKKNDDFWIDDQQHNRGDANFRPHDTGFFLINTRRIEYLVKSIIRMVIPLVAPLEVYCLHDQYSYKNICIFRRQALYCGIYWRRGTRSSSTSSRSVSRDPVTFGTMTTATKPFCSMRAMRNALALSRFY